MFTENYIKTFGLWKGLMVKVFGTRISHIDGPYKMTIYRYKGINYISDWE